MPQAATTSSNGAQLMRAARWFDTHGNVVVAICVYREVILAGVEPEASEARQRIAGIAGGSETDLPA